ncbi:hypothetical protein Tco_1030186 [Tanacetum coccineum]|uniref:Uncharacterized protein n=1 Tax=Tanacetum coccineum TaxID=301880 RepID=A0ABQ5G5X4_9ASTR
MSQKRAIITHDGKVYIFHTKINEVNAPATCLGLLFDDPLEPRPTIYFCGVAEGVKDYLDLKYASEITRMFPSRHTKDGFSILGDLRGDFKMTTSVGNNSVFRSFFEKQKLTRPNFIDWYKQLRLVLSTEDKENYLEHPIPAAPVAQPGQQVPPKALAAHAAWVKG